MREQVIAHLEQILGHEPSEDQILTMLNGLGLIEILDPDFLKIKSLEEDDN